MEKTIFSILWIVIGGLFAFSCIAHAKFVIYILKKKKEYHLGFGKVIGFLLYLFSQFMMNVIFLYATVKFEKMYVGMMTIVALIITFFPIGQLKKILDDVIEKASVDEKYEYIIRKSEIGQKYYLMMKDYEDRLSKLRHEFMNQVQVAYSIIEKSANNQVGIEMLDELSEQIESTRVNAFCSNKMVNIILSMKHDEFMESNLKLKTDVILPGEIGVEEMDLCFVIMSMLDELIEIENAKGTGESDVIFDIHRKNGMIRVMTKQQAVEETSGSTECDKVINYYKKMMKPVIDKYNGEMYVKTDEQLTIIVTMQELLKN